jgi:hypothetical protein
LMFRTGKRTTEHPSLMVLCPVWLRTLYQGVGGKCWKDGWSTWTTRALTIRGHLKSVPGHTRLCFIIRCGRSTQESKTHISFVFVNSLENFSDRLEEVWPTHAIRVSIFFNISQKEEVTRNNLGASSRMRRPFGFVYFVLWWSIVRTFDRI